jgi:hypothetical protein
MAVTHANGHSHTYYLKDDVKTLDTLLTLLRGAMIDELCALRRDLDTIRLGHWKMDLGPFVHATEEGATAAETLRQQLNNRLGVSRSTIPLPITLTHSDEDSPPVGASSITKEKPLDRVIW